MADQISEADIWLSRVNIAHARSQKLLESWLPKSNSSSTSATTNSNTHEDENDQEEDDFIGMTESAGLGTRPKDSDVEVDGILKKRHASSQDKLLEQLLGKKAAAAKRKEQAFAKQTKSNIALGRTGPLPATSLSAPSSKPGPSSSSSRSAPAIVAEDDDDDEEDEPGRAATFTGKRITRDRNLPAYAVGGDHGGRDSSPIDADATPPDPRDDVATIKAMVKGTSQAEHELAESDAEEEEQRPRKKKATSYLDELLSKKKKKKGKGGKK
ncbi:hypothetical protein Slin15195_G084570 [Septoria linicola]|uniref:Uncharacterized protein n=1 Tax=Septoria linicola TaxID=215465 RepID=A0A9Q9B012_9PEZI|nr:hypothetical protein Slin15195_G084570 [Septoria linicola]